MFRFKNPDGAWLEGRQSTGSLLLHFFQSLYASFFPSFPSDLELLILPSISGAENEALTLVPSGSEIFRALVSMDLRKAPGPDGMTGLFYKSCWLIVSVDVIAVIQNFFLTGELLSAINETNLVLIPKIQHPRLPSHFRPISLCNVCYKIIAKLLADRLKPLLANLISPFQLAFILGF